VPPLPAVDAKAPTRAAVLQRLALLGVLTLHVALVGILLADRVSIRIPGSLAFAAVLVVASLLARVALPASFRDRGLAVAATASAGAAPFIAFCCDRALTVPTVDSIPRDGIGWILAGGFMLFLLAAGPLAAFLLAIPLGLWPGGVTRAVMRSLAALALAVAVALTIGGAVRRSRFPEPDGYVASLPSVAQIDGDACAAARCVRCPPGPGERSFTVVTPAGARELGPIEAPCDHLRFWHDPGRGLLLVGGDVDRGGAMRSSPQVWVYDEATGQQGERRLHDLSDTLGPPLAWVIGTGVGCLLALAALVASWRQPAAESDAASRATACAAVAFTTAVLFATPLAAAWHEGLVGAVAALRGPTSTPPSSPSARPPLLPPPASPPPSLPRSLPVTLRP